MSNYNGYTLTDNLRRKANNIECEINDDLGQNRNIKEYTTKASAQSEAARKKEAKEQKEKSITSLKEWTKEEIEEFNKIRSQK